MKNQTGIGEPMRDWFPISFMGSFTDWADVTHGAEKEFGQLTCGCHPNCGVGMAIMIDKETKEAVPVTAFLKAEQLAKDVARSATPAAAASCRCSAWRWRSCATTTRSNRRRTSS